MKKKEKGQEEKNIVLTSQNITSEMGLHAGLYRDTLCKSYSKDSDPDTFMGLLSKVVQNAVTTCKV